MGSRRHSEKNKFYLGNFWFVSQNKIFPKKICKNLKNPRFLKVFLKNLQKPKEKYIFFQNKNGNQKQISFLKNVCFYCVLPYKTALGGSWWGAWPYIYIYIKTYVCIELESTSLMGSSWLKVILELSKMLWNWWQLQPLSATPCWVFWFNEWIRRESAPWKWTTWKKPLGLLVRNRVPTTKLGQPPWL